MTLSKAMVDSRLPIVNMNQLPVVNSSRVGLVVMTICITYTQAHSNSWHVPLVC